MTRVAASLVLLAVAANAESVISPGFNHFYNLEYEPAIAEFQKEIQASPNDPEPYNHLAQTLLYREMFKSGTLESEMVTGTNPLHRDKLVVPPDVEKQFLDAIAKAMELAQAKIDKQPNDAKATYALCVAHGLRGNWNFLVRKAYFDALHDLTTSRKLGNHTLQLDPSFIDVKLVQGVHDYVVGSLPAYVRMLGFLAGFHGDKDLGIRELQEVAARGKLSDADAKILLGVIYRREKRPADAIPLLDDLIRRFPRNYILHFELAQMWADQGDGTKALAAVDKVEALRQAGVSGYGTLSAEKVHYVRGNIQFWYNDLDGAVANLRKATQGAAKLDLHTALMAWLRLGQTYDLKQDRKNAQAAYQQVLTLASSSEMAKEARRYQGRPYRRT